MIVLVIFCYLLLTTQVNAQCCASSANAIPCGCDGSYPYCGGICCDGAYDGTVITCQSIPCSIEPQYQQTCNQATSQNWALIGGLIGGAVGLVILIAICRVCYKDPPTCCKRKPLIKSDAYVLQTPLKDNRKV